MSDELRYNEFERDGFDHITIANRWLEADFVPELGGKMAQLTHVTSGTDFLLSPQTADGSYSEPEYGDDFDAYDTSGFDECFPTVAEAEVEINGKKYAFPDHGELWSRKWKVQKRDHSLTLSIDGVKWDYTFAKRIFFEDQSVIIRYSLENLEDEPFPFIWSAHPLLKIVPDSRLLLADSVDNVLVNWASDPAIGSFGDEIAWPFLLDRDRSVDFTRVPDRSLGKTVKVFTPRLKEGKAALYRADRDESIIFEFDSDEVPYLGLWLCYGGWPVDVPDDQKHMTLGIEPTSGRPDGLDDALDRQEYALLGAGDTKNWMLKLHVNKGKVQDL